MAHVCEEGRLGDVGRVGRFLCLLQRVVRMVDRGGAFDYGQFNAVIGQLELGLAQRDGAHFGDALQAHDEKKDVLEKDPASVLDPAEVVGSERAEDRLRPVDAADEVIEGNHDGCRHQHAPVAVKGEEGKGTEDVKVGLDPPAGQIDEQRRHEHLRERDDVSRQGRGPASGWKGRLERR